MILTLSKNHECIMSNSYISSMLNISKVHASRLISSLRDKGYINVKIIYKENSKQILKRVLTPIGDTKVIEIIAILILLNFMLIIFRKDLKRT